MTALVINDPTVSLVSESATVDLSDYVVGVDVDNQAAPVDVGTFATPNAQKSGRVQTNVTLSLLWSEGLMDDLEALVGVPLTMQLIPDGAYTKSVQVPCEFGALPFGTFALGERVEVDLPLAVTAAVDWAAIL